MGNDPVLVITTIGISTESRLTPLEVEELFRFAYALHDHHAQTPAQPIFWHRGDGQEVLRSWN
jgi:hypothetical protein